MASEHIINIALAIAIGTDFDDFVNLAQGSSPAVLLNCLSSQVEPEYHEDCFPTTSYQ